MSLVRFTHAAQDTPTFGWMDDQGIRRLGDASVELVDLFDRVDSIDDLGELAEGPSIPESDVTLRCPAPRPRRVLAAAGNYVAAGRASLRGDAQPWLFAKMADGVLGPGDTITIPPLAGDVVEEIELAAVIGRSGSDIPVDRALEHVAGWTICNDVSARTLKLDSNRRQGDFAPFFDWLNGKWFDGFLCLGPRIVGTRELGGLLDLRIATRVNGELRVEGSTATLTFRPEELVAFASRLMTLRPGDVISTGMPHGLGPETYLRDGDKIEGTIDRIGTLSNVVRVGSSI